MGEHNLEEITSDLKSAIVLETVTNSSSNHNWCWLKCTAGGRGQTLALFILMGQNYDYRAQSALASLMADYFSLLGIEIATPLVPCGRQ